MRFYRAFLGTFFSSVRTFFGALLGLIFTPIIVSYLGEEPYGVFRILTDWMIQLGLLEFGLYGSLLPLYSQALAKRKQGEVRSITLQAFKQYAWVILFQLIGFCLIFLFRDQLFSVESSLREELRVTLLIIAIPLLWQFSQIFRAFLEAKHFGYEVSLVNLAHNSSFILLAAVSAYLGYGLIGQAISFTLSLALIPLILGLRSLRAGILPREKSPTDRIELPKIPQGDRLRIFTFNLTGQVSLYFDNIIIGIIINPKTVAAFYLTQRLASLAQGQLLSFGGSAWPAMSELHHKGEKKLFEERFINVTEFISYFSGVLLSTLCFVNPSFVHLWTGESTFAGLGVHLLSLGNVAIIALLSFWNWCFATTGLIRLILPLVCTQAICNLLLSFFFTSWLGAAGPLLGTFVACLSTALFWEIALLKNTFGIPRLKLLRSFTFPLVLPLSLSCFFVFNFGYPLFEHWWELILFSGTLTIVLGGFFYLFLVSRSGKMLVKEKGKYLIDKFFKRKFND